MGRRNQRGLDLSFKPTKGGRGRGRWLKKIDGTAYYFGWGDGVSDRKSYQAALAKYRRWIDERRSASATHQRSVVTRRLQQSLARLDDRPDVVNLEAVRSLLEQHAAIGADAKQRDEFARAADEVERLQRLAKLQDHATLDQLRSIDAPGKKPPKTLAALLDEFVIAQRQRMERRKKLDALRAAGEDVHEARRENLSPGRFVEITYNVATFKQVCGTMAWDGTEATAARIVLKFRQASEKRMLDGEIKPRSFNKLIVLARQFCGWAESVYLLERIPRDTRLFVKYDVGKSQAKAIPLDVLRRLYLGADQRGRCFILLGLNCGFYGVDISDLTAEQIGKTHLSHVRGKAGVRVKYLLWPKTSALLKVTAARKGRAFLTREGTPLIRYSKLAVSGEPARVDNVRNWWIRLCSTVGVQHFAFSNVRDTASTAVESIDPALNDLFLAHRDERMAKFYVDEEMVDTSALDRLICEMERRFAPVFRK